MAERGGNLVSLQSWTSLDRREEKFMDDINKDARDAKLGQREVEEK